MSGVLADPAPSAVAAAIERNPVEYWRICCSYLPGAEFHADDEITWCTTGHTTAPWLNHVLRARFRANGVHDRIEMALAPFAERRLPMLWSVGPSDRPPRLEAALKARGLTPWGKLVGMAIDLQTLQDASPAPAHLEIEGVASREALERWARAYIGGFEMAEAAGRAIFDLYAAVGFADELPFRHYVGFLGGQPVASSTLFLGAGVAGVYHVGTLPAARGQGIGAAMTLAALREGRDLGYRIGTLYASPMGRSVYLGLGFREHYTLAQYRWPPDGGAP